MPIDTNSDKWNSGAGMDWPVVYVNKVLKENRDHAYTAKEIAERLVENHSETLPTTLRISYQDGEEAPLISYVSSTLAHMQWRGLVDYSAVEEDGESVLYFTYTTENCRYPIADIVDDLSPRVDDLEENHSEDVTEIREQLRQIENRLYELEY